MVVDIPDIISYANFGEDRLKGLGVAGIKICPSPLTLIVALTALSHYCASVWLILTYLVSCTVSEIYIR